MKNYILSEIENKNKIINFGFSYINKIFIDNDWNLSKNTYNEIIYSKKNTSHDEFVIKVNEKTIDVYIPLKNKNIIYKTTFSSYFDASEYIELHLDSYLDNN